LGKTIQHARASRLNHYSVKLMMKLA
jgi:hypothetical protein